MVKHVLMALLHRRMTCVGVAFALFLPLSGLAQAPPTSAVTVTGDDLDQCSPSEQTYQHDESVFQYLSNGRNNSLTRLLPISPARMLSLRHAVRGLNCSGTPLVGFDGHRFFAGFPDDPGLFLLVPAIAVHSRMPLAAVLDLTLLSIILVTTAIGYAGYWRLFAGARARLVGAAVFVFLAVVQMRGGEVYMFQSAPVIAAVPWLIGYAFRQDRSRLAVTCVLFALVAGGCTLVRSTAGMPCMAFVALLVLCTFRVPRALALLLLIAAAYVLPQLIYRQDVKHRDAFLASVPGSSRTPVDHHLFWHTVYIGLGYWPNREVARYADESADENVALIGNVAYGSPEYEATLRHEVWRIFTHEPQIVLINLALKFGAMFIMILALTFPAIPSIRRRKKQLWFDGPFAAGISASTLIGLISVPNPKYLLGMISFVVMYALLSWALDQQRRDMTQF